MTVCGGAVTKLAIRIFAPTFDRAVVEKGACVLKACGHLHGRSSRAKRSGEGRCGTRRGGGGSVAELTLKIATPTRHFSTV